MSLQTFFDNFALLADSPNGIAKLREVILKLAVEGKLISQDLHEEPATVLFAKVSKEKKRLIKEGKINNKRLLPEIKDGEKFFELPENWVWVRLGEIVDQRLGKMLDKGKNKGKPYPYLRNTNVQWLRFDLSDVKEMRFEESELDEYEVRPGDLLVCEGGEPGRCAIWDRQLEQIMFQKAIHRIRPFAGINSWFLLYRLLADAMAGNLEKHFTGATIKHFTGQEIAKYVIGLPPLEEQKRIVAKVDELMRLCDELEARQQQRRASRVRLNNATLAPLNNAATLAPEEFEQACARLADNFATLYDSAETVSRLRSTILQLAVQGKLVPQDAKDELASVLLNKIKKRKDTLIKEKKIKPDRIGTNIVEDDSVSTLPKGWEWTRLNEILTSLRNGIAIPPQTVGNSRILRISALRPNAVNIEEYRYLPEAPESYKDFKIHASDLLFTRYSGNRDFVGICGVVPPHQETLIHPDKLIRGCLIPDGLIPEFVSIAINTGVSRLFIEKQLKTTAGQVGISGRELKMTPVPVAPLEEQKRIVAKVNQLMALCDELEAKLRQTETDGERLMKAAVRRLLDSLTAGQTRAPDKRKSNANPSSGSVRKHEF